MGLLDTMRAYYCIPSNDQHTSSSTSTSPPWLPETYELDLPSDCLALLKSEDEVKNDTGNDGMWIYKPTSSNRYINIYIYIYIYTVFL